MNTLRKTLLLSLTLQVCLAAGIFAAAEEAPLALITIPLAIGSLVVIDYFRWIRPVPWSLNLAALGALGLSLSEFMQQGESRLLAGGHLIVYLTWTFLLQVKDLRRMWWMFALSMLQVALGAVLTFQPWFGAALFVYTASAVWTMSLLSLMRAALLIDPDLLAGPPRQASTEHESESQTDNQSSVRNGIRTDDQGRWISPQFLGGGVMTFLLSMAIGLTFFVLTPRIWLGSLNVFGDSPLRRPGGATGFTDNVKLGDIGTVMESTELVMNVMVRDSRTGVLIPPEQLAEAVGDEPLFRGAVLESYSEQGWKKENRRGWSRTVIAPAPIQLDVTVQPMDTAVLFYTGTPAIQGIRGTAISAVGMTHPQELVFHPLTLALETDGADPEQPYSYSVFTRPPGDTPDSIERRLMRDAIRIHGYPNYLRPLLRTPTPRLSQLAQEILKRLPVDGESVDNAKARALEAHLRDSGEYSYTLNLSVDDPTIDPVEDFVFNRKKGHCEYFASALALMLRGAGIPSRLISGFKGAEYNTTTRQLEVRALHAHAWVEAYVDGGWVTLDPTPGNRDAEVADRAKDAEPNLVDRTRSFWFQGMSYSKSQQEELVYTPIRELGTFLRSNFQGIMQGELPLLAQIRSLSASPRSWFSGQGGMVAFTLGLLLAGTIWLIRRFVKRWRGWSRQRSLAQRRAVTVEFHARLMALLRRVGLIEEQHQTSREFALLAEDRLQEKLREAGLTGAPSLLVELFYAVRFGEQSLTPSQIADVDEQLKRLEVCLK